MRKYLYSENGFVEKAEWKPNCWVNVECPDDSDFQFLTQELKVPESFLEDIADTDERPRTETEGNWLLTILRIPMQSSQHGIPFITVPIGIITNNDIIVSVCYHHTELIPDFIQHTRRKGIVVNNKLTLILRIIYSSAVWFLKYLKQINNDVATAEKELEKRRGNQPSPPLYFCFPALCCARLLTIVRRAAAEPFRHGPPPASASASVSCPPPCSPHLIRPL